MNIKLIGNGGYIVMKSEKVLELNKQIDTAYKKEMELKEEQTITDFDQYIGEEFLCEMDKEKEASTRKLTAITICSFGVSLTLDNTNEIHLSDDCIRIPLKENKLLSKKSLPVIQMKRFYRVCNTTTNQGLWYDYKGVFTGLIHEDFNFCVNHTLEMEHHDEVVGYLSVAEDMDTLLKWFTKEDILQLQEHGYYIHVYESDNYKFYDRFQHYLMHQETCNLVEKIEL